MFGNLLKTRLRESNRAKTPPPYSSPSLEELESRLAPVGVDIYTDIILSVQIIPNFFNLTILRRNNRQPTHHAPKEYCGENREQHRVDDPFLLGHRMQCL